MKAWRRATSTGMRCRMAPSPASASIVVSALGYENLAQRYDADSGRNAKIENAIHIY